MDKKDTEENFSHNKRTVNELITFTMLKTASPQLVFSGLRDLLGLQSHMKSTPQMFPL